MKRFFTALLAGAALLALVTGCPKQEAPEDTEVTKENYDEAKMQKKMDEMSEEMKGKMGKQDE